MKMIINRDKIILKVFLILLISFLSSPPLLSQESVSSKKWLAEVEPIITKAEEDVFKSLKTEEDRKRFIKSFWIARDPNPQTPQNEYKRDYYERLSYAKSRLGGIRSDRGRIYMILGKPRERSNYGGVAQVVDCELWTYYSEGKGGLPPIIKLLFYKRRNVGEYKLFHPGIHNPIDLLSPGYQSGGISKYDAYQEIKKSYAELAEATLSVIPGEGSPRFATSLSSNFVFARINTLPEKEASRSYLKNFKSLKGIVDVKYSSVEIKGNAQISISENKGYKFLNYAVMPNVIHTVSTKDIPHMAKLQVILRIEDLEGRTISQKEKNIEFKLTELEKKNIEDKKVVFRDFLPIIEGNFIIRIVFLNKSKEEIFSYEEKISVTDQNSLVLLGCEAEKISSDKFMPFSAEGYKIFSDPRFIFNKNDSITGLIFTKKKPDIRLAPFDGEKESFAISNIVREGDHFVFKYPLEDITPAYYNLIVKHKGAEICRQPIIVPSKIVKEPLWFDLSDQPSSENSYIFEMAKQYLNFGDVEKAIEYFNRLPKKLWNTNTLPIIARAYYRKKNYKKVIELLDRENVSKDYSVLFFLGNSCLELKQLEKAGEYFEKLRNYGDTAKINQILGAIYLSLGERKKAKVYFDRAKKLKQKSKLNKKEENNK